MAIIGWRHYADRSFMPIMEWLHMRSLTALSIQRGNAKFEVEQSVGVQDILGLVAAKQFYQ